MANICQISGYEIVASYKYVRIVDIQVSLKINCIVIMIRMIIKVIFPKTKTRKNTVPNHVRKEKVPHLISHVTILTPFL